MDRDYEKAHKEALERAKKELKTCGSLDCDAARLIFRLFPQLAESEDEKMRKAILAAIRQGLDTEKALAKYNVTYDDVEAWLEKQKAQKPAEWSEEDEEKLKAICTYLRDYPRLAKLGDKLRFNEYCDFLESLRPQGSKDSLQTRWKPTEEQMEALKEALETYNGFEEYDAMKSLYNDLKKL